MNTQTDPRGRPGHLRCSTLQRLFPRSALCWSALCWSALCWSALLLPALAGCQLTQPTAVNAPPVLFQSEPTLPVLMQTINESSSRVTSLQSTGADLKITSLSGVPSLQASLAVERPSRFRLQAATSFTGPELDLGSNDQQYWIWIRQSEPKALYYGQHSEFHLSQGRQILPIPPHWLIEALGIVFFDPLVLHEGPYSSRPDVFEIRSQVPSPMGTLRKTSLVDWRRAVVTEQHLYDAGGTRLASVRADNFHYDPIHNVTLPRKVEVDLPTANLAFTLRIYGYSINQLIGESSALFAVPQIEGYPAVDLARGPRPSQLTQIAPYEVPSREQLRMLPPVGIQQQRLETAQHRRIWPFRHIR